MGLLRTCVYDDMAEPGSEEEEHSKDTDHVLL